MLELLGAIKTKVFIVIVTVIGGILGIPQIAPPQNYIPPIEISTVATTTAQKIAANSPKSVVNEKAQNLLGLKEKVVAPKPAAVAVAPKTLLPLEPLNDKVREAIVNILCTTKTAGDLNPITGSGIIIDPRGVILTNAHVGQYFLLRDYRVKNFVSCIGRAGSPAQNAYQVELLYISKSWVEENVKTIKDENPQGTGENDYALFLIKGSATARTLPEKLPFIEIDTDQNNILGTVPVLLSGYPAGFLGGIETQRELSITSSPGIISKIYYFQEKENLDAFSIDGNILAQKGSSGGAAVSQWTGKLQGIPTTITEGKTTGERELLVISLPHIDRSFKKETGKSLSEFLKEDLNEALSNFNQSDFPILSKKFIDALTSTSTPSN